MITRGRPPAVLAVSWTFFAFVACSDSGSSRTAPADGGVDGASGGSTGDGSASSGGGGAGGAASGSGGGITATGARTGSGGAPVPEAGPTCTPRDQVPAPKIPSVDLSSTCSGPPVSGCTANLAGTSWGLDTVCLDASALFPQATAVCSGVSFGSVSQNTLSGTASFTADSVKLDLEVSASAMLTFPNYCHGCRCSDLETQLLSAGLSGVSCSPVCDGGDCTCFVDTNSSIQASSPYTLSGGRLTAGVVSMDACAAPAALTLEQGSTHTVFTLRPAAALSTPEICNGRDDDGDGQVDDSPVDCPPCLDVGVCGDGVTATCNGASGWTCTYTSAAYEATTETTCDRKDNDCDGLVDEDLPCRETCDGKDNDGNGLVDDDPLDAPACGGVGVCASGTTPTCNGTAGWSCVSTSTDFEVVESRCDGKDNDCNGLTDEHCCAAGSERVYYSYQSYGDAGLAGCVIERSHTDGTGREALVTLPQTPCYVIDVSVDPVGGKVYWVDVIAETISRANLDGSGIETPFSGMNQPRLALDLAHRYLFFKSSTGVDRASLSDPSKSTTILTGEVPMSMTVDAADGWLFMSEAYSLARSNLDGSALITQDQNVGAVLEGITWDPVGRKVYWTSGGGLFRANPDLSNPESLLSLSYPVKVNLDPAGRRLYWSETAKNRIGSMTVDALTPTYVDYPDEVIFGQFLACP